jgi:ATP-dependent Clp protease ATP-binding subunit ClpA
MLTTNDVDYLLQATTSSVKRFGGAGPTLSHLAYVLSAKWHRQFVGVFGEDGSADVKRILARRQYVGDEADVRSLLSGGDSPAAVLADLHARLSSVIEASPTTQDAGGSPDTAEATADEPGVETHPAATSDGETGWPQRTRRFLQPVDDRVELLEREEAITQVVSIVSRHRRRVPIIVGARGSGRTTLLGGIAAKLHDKPTDEQGFVWRVAPETLGPDPAGALSRIVDDCEAPTILFVDDFDRLAGLGTAQPNGGVLRLLGSAFHHPDLRIVLVCDARYHRRLGMYAEDLEQDLIPVRLDALTETAITTVVDGAVPAIESVYAVTISPALRSLTRLPSRSTDQAVHPGLALDRLDAAASRAAVLGDSVADIAHLAGSTSSGSGAAHARELEELLAQRVQGQSDAIRAVASRLALTLARLDLRPERPDGVFLFVGPTGVGKTELARAIATSLFGSEDRLIRLDMSEYSHDWAVSRLTGPMPGFVGSTEPESWLTTKIAQMPDCVVLLDEIEKAHPVVWNTFLQVFDAGRLTDSRGLTADFSNVVIVMTSNIGAAAAASTGLGFGSEKVSVVQARERITHAVKEAMPPELVNRIDELVVFDALTLEAIGGIAERELSRVCARLAESGWTVSYDPAVIQHLVTTGYDPAYGARHLQRNIERLFLGLIAQSETRTVTVGVSEGSLTLRD